MTDLVATATKVVKTLTNRDLTLCTAESLTGGLLGASITEIPGASKVYLGGVVAYHSTMKAILLHVDEADIAAHTVVSGEVAADMAYGVQSLTDGDWSIGVTGVAGPDAQDGHAPGEVWISIVGPTVPSLPKFNLSHRFQFEGDRSAIREATVNAALELLLRAISPV